MEAQIKEKKYKNKYCRPIKIGDTSWVVSRSMIVYSENKKIQRNVTAYFTELITLDHTARPAYLGVIRAYIITSILDDINNWLKVRWLTREEIERSIPIGTKIKMIFGNGTMRHEVYNGQALKEMAVIPEIAYGRDCDYSYVGMMDKLLLAVKIII